MSNVAALATELASELNDVRQASEVIAALLDVPRSWPRAHGEEPVDADVRTKAREAVRRLQAGAPLAYAVQRACFRHLTLHVDERVLIPRPETELLIDEVLALVQTGVAVDIGTGSGALALSLASEGRFDHVIATDVSADALEVARRNAAEVQQAVRCPVSFRQGSLFAPLEGDRADLIVSNPPYIAYNEAEELPALVREWEPPTALFSGGNGVAVTAEIVRGAADLLTARGVLAIEVDVRRASLVAEMLATDNRYSDVQVRLDLTGRERFVLARRR